MMPNVQTDLELDSSSPLLHPGKKLVLLKQATHLDLYFNIFKVIICVYVTSKQPYEYLGSNTHGMKLFNMTFKSVILF